MRMRRQTIPWAFAIVGLTLHGCGDDDGATCGEGTELVGGECIASGGGDAGPDDPKEDASISCGDRTFEVDGKCVGKLPVGAECTRGSECEAGSCLGTSDGFPGGYCSEPNCNDVRTCPGGSYCLFSSASNRSICLAYCEEQSDCRDNYVCQPVYGTPHSLCSPRCNLSNACPDQTQCDTESGKCVLRECDPDEADSCDTTASGRICYPDSRNLTTKGGLCLSTCDPKSPDCNAGDVCQPLPEDPANKGICTPPGCKATADCRAGAVCKDSVCQPPARCDDAGACADDTTACVGGPGGQCMPKCPSEGSCSDAHAGLVCAQNVAASPVCLPEGSFPGSACRADKNSPCDSVRAGNGSAEMVCENNTCLVACSAGGDGLCGSVNGSLSCATEVFDQPVCLPDGAFPAGPCGNDDSCQNVDLGGGVSAKMACKADRCVFDCGESAIGSANGEAYCATIDDSLTCATDVYPDSAVCLPQGSFPGGPCSHGTCSKLGDADMVCEDNQCLVTCSVDNDTCGAIEASLVCAAGIFAEPVCLPKGSFPGGACGGANNDQCAQDLNGVSEVDMQCVSGRCVIGCDEEDRYAGYGESLCRFADPSLTCAAAAGDVCVKACVSGACDGGYSCFDPGTAPADENACLPNGSFPGAACAGDTCGPGPGGSTMSCRSGRCVVNCPAGAPGDTLCGQVNSALTCSDAAGGFCLPACQSGNCPDGLSCLAAPGENACLPNGSFLGARCATGNVCSGDPMLVCVPGGTPVCGAGCSIANGQPAANTYCATVGSAVGQPFDTCTNLGGSLYVCTE